MTVQSKVHVELTIDGITYEIELADAEATFGIEHEDRVVPSDKPWIVREPTGHATIQLQAFGWLVKSERRTDTTAIEATEMGA